MEKVRESKKCSLNDEIIDLTNESSSDDLIFQETRVGDISISSTEILESPILNEIQKVERSHSGAFDGSLIKSVHEKEDDPVEIQNMLSRSDKRFEAGLGMGLVKNEFLPLKPVSNSLTTCILFQHHKRNF